MGSFDEAIRVTRYRICSWSSSDQDTRAGMKIRSSLGSVADDLVPFLKGFARAIREDWIIVGEIGNVKLHPLIARRDKLARPSTQETCKLCESRYLSYFVCEKRN